MVVVIERFGNNRNKALGPNYGVFFILMEKSNGTPHGNYGQSAKLIKGKQLIASFFQLRNYRRFVVGHVDA